MWSGRLRPPVVLPFWNPTPCFPETGLRGTLGLDAKREQIPELDQRLATPPRAGSAFLPRPRPPRSHPRSLPLAETVRGWPFSASNSPRAPLRNEEGPGLGAFGNFPLVLSQIHNKTDLPMKVVSFCFVLFFKRNHEGTKHLGSVFFHDS